VDDSKDYYVHPSACVDEGAEIGSGTKIWHFCHVSSGCEIGGGCTVGQNVFVAPGVKIGSHCKIQNNVSVYEGVELGDYVFCGPSMVFTNVQRPRCKYPQRGSEFYAHTPVGEGASIGANATIVCGHRVGKNAFVAAGSVVTRDVPDHAIVMGCPARVCGWACECGAKLGEDLACPKCGRKYVRSGDGLKEETESMQKIAFNDLGAQYRHLKKEIDEGIAEVLAGSRFISGPQVEELEKALCRYTGRKHCVTTDNGTDALLMPLMAKGIGKGDAVFVPSFTFFASAEVVSLVGATPVFCDSDADTFNLDPDSLLRQIAKVKREGKLKPKAVIAVDLFGQPADFLKIQRICDEYGLFLLEDAAQGFGGAIGGRKACSFGDCSGTSFFPAKALGCYGDGGAVFTDDEELYRLLTSIRVHGKGAVKYENVRLGLNARLDTLQAAILLPKLRAFDRENAHRIRAAARYAERLRGRFAVPVVREGFASSFAYYTLKAESAQERAKAMEALKAEGIPTMIYYPKPLHLQKVYEPLGYRKGDLPVAEKLAETVFSLPMHGYITDDVIDRICSVLKNI
jgi:dTDP-4-amino-4,6-dideoxygalactose transaminase/acetyltransferase-like isoleucine patch superfamily enzyme